MINLEKLQEIGLLLKKSTDESKIYIEILKVVSDTIEFHFSTIFIYNENFQLEPIYSKNDVVVDLAADFNIGNGNGIAGWVSDNDNPIIFSNFMNENTGRKFNSFVSIPLIIDSKRIGVLNLGHNTSGYYDEKDKSNFKIMGGQVAIILDKIKLKKELNTKTNELEATLKELKTVQEKLEQKEKFSILGEDAMAFNKEINNPLSVIMGFSDLLLNKCKSGNVDGEIFMEKLEVILDSARKINTIIHHFEQTQSKN